MNLPYEWCSECEEWTQHTISFDGTTTTFTCTECGHEHSANEEEGDNSNA
jgi:uncharacterized Zn finger protein